ncbi:HAD family hydrolase [uncultured Microbacterium sp.]|uniref:HAD family hydrolase n=1 Tax=uncultured Microbacterium sp. TaxID=191216 RepID=UPI002631EC38|nr:HAD family hydrolase [uncultured Microbacterium sp.]
MTRIETVVLDMAGTTVADDGLVVSAFTRAWDRLPAAASLDRDAAIAHVVATMGQSKIEVFRGLVDEDAAHELNGLFEAALDELVAESATALPGAEDTIRALQGDGRTVVLTTGFSRTTVDALLARLGWEDLVEIVLTPADAGRGRPAPDLNLLAAIRTGVSSVDALAVVGDTESDAHSGVRAGAGLVVAVRTGGHTAEDALRNAGAAHVLDSVAALPELLSRLGR